MERSLINELVESVALSGELSQKDLNRLFEIFSRNDLKIFIRLLAREIKNKTVTAIYAGEMAEETKNKISALFPGKTAVFKRDDDAIIAGVRFEHGDFVLDYSATGAIKRILNELRERI